jgi:hypothetical protein
VSAVVDDDADDGFSSSLFFTSVVIVFSCCGLLVEEEAGWDSFVVLGGSFFVTSPGSFGTVASTSFLSSLLFTDFAAGVFNGDG